jgi:hypothetical protein
MILVDGGVGPAWVPGPLQEIVVNNNPAERRMIFISIYFF